MKKYLAITEYETDEIVKKIDITDMPKRQIERIERGLLMQMNREDFFIREIEEV